MSDGPTRFIVVPFGAQAPAEAGAAYLQATRWDDMFRFETQFKLWIRDEDDVLQDIGFVKIGRTGMWGSEVPGSAERCPLLSNSFERLSEEYFSVGQDESFYAKLNEFDGTVRDGVLVALRDVAFNAQLFEEHLSEPVMIQSLLRHVSRATVQGQFRRLARGGARLTAFNYQYQLRNFPGSDSSPPTLTFAVTPGSMPPTNVHVVIGRNGSGKTDALTHMAKSLIESTTNTPTFSSVVSVSFSAFDAFELPEERRAATTIPRFAYVGLRKRAASGETVGVEIPQPNVSGERLKSLADLSEEFVESMRVCRDGVREPRWRQALATLEQDSNFRDAEISAWGNNPDTDDPAMIDQLYRRLSSGHKIVLLTITRLVELVEEKTLVLIDEPEGHLHPPLLSAFIRALSELLVTRNGMSIIATHSPVVLQETPRDCVWKLSRYGAECRADRPAIETFGENVGILTRETFGLDVSRTGFHQMLADAVENGGTYDEIVAQFNNKLGAEARAILRALVASRTVQS